MASELHETAAARLRRVGQRYTPNRRSLVGILAQAGQPVAIPDVLAADRSLAQSSAYRNLATLMQAGVVRRVVTSDEFARFELAEDLTEHHHHLVCSACGLVEDFTAPAGFERSLHRTVSKVSDATGFSVDTHRLDLIGTCTRCS